MARILIIQGHPTRGGGHLCHALADAYADGATAGGHEVRRLIVTELEFPVLRDRVDWEKNAPPPDIVRAQGDIGWANHLVIIYPLWLGALPALLKAFLEQVFRPGFAFALGSNAGGPQVSLKGRSARTIVTMGMPGLVYRWWFGALTLRSLEQNILAFVGIGPCRHTVIGMVEGMSETKRKSWFDEVRRLGRAAR
jgi:putative NADPH-quinone reductase